MGNNNCILLTTFERLSEFAPNAGSHNTTA